MTKTAREIADELNADVVHQLTAGSKTTVTSQEDSPSFSSFWMLATLIAFMVCNSFLSGVLPRGSMHGNLLAEAVCNFLTYYLGGAAIGLISPQARDYEIAAGGALSMLLVMFVGMWLPIGFFGASPMKIGVMTLLAAGLALTGADMGRKLKGRA